MLALTHASVERICRATRRNINDQELFAGLPPGQDPWGDFHLHALREQVEMLADEGKQAGPEFKRLCTLYSALTGEPMLASNEVYDARTFDLFQSWQRRREDRAIFTLETSKVGFTCGLIDHFKLYKPVSSLLVPRLLVAGTQEGVAEVRILVPNCAISYMLRADATRFRDLRGYDPNDPNTTLMIKEIVSAFAILNELRLPRVWWADTDRTHSLAAAYLIARAKKAQSE